MPRLFGGGTTTRGRRLFAGTSSGGTDLEAILNAEIAKKGEPPEKVGFMTRFGNVMSAFSPGGEFATMYRTERQKIKEGATPLQAIGSGYKEAGKQYVPEVLRGLGSALPFLDKYTKPNDLNQKREGFTEAIEEGMRLWGKEPPKSGIGHAAIKTAGIAGDIGVDPGNLLLAPLFGKIIGGGKALAKGGEQLLSKSEKGQDILKVITGATETAKEAFIPAYKANKISPELVDTVKTLQRTTAIGDKEAVEQVVALANKHGMDAIRKAAQEIDEGKKLSPLAQEINDVINKGTSGEIELGLRKATNKNYFPHKVIREPMSGYTAGQTVSESTLKGAQKARTYATKAEGIKAGYKYMDDPEALSYRLATSQRAQKTKGAMNQLIAGTIKDVDGNALVKTWKKGTKLMDGHVPVIIDNNGVKVGEKALSFFPVETATGTTLRAVRMKPAVYQMPKDAAEYLSEAQKVFGNDKATREIIKIYDIGLNLFKRSVTQYFPAFHFRNFMGNIFNNFIGGVYDPRSYIDAGKIQHGKGILAPEFQKIFPEAKTYEDARKTLELLGVRNRGQFAVDAPKYFKQQMPDPNKLKQLAKNLADAPGEGGTILENNARIAHYINKVRKGMGAEEAVKSVNKFLFDYQDLSKFETEKLKRIMPFYTFTRKNIPLQLEQIIKQPVKYKATLDALRGLQSGDLTDEEKKYMPDYIRETFGINLGKSQTGDPQILAGIGIPLEDLSKLDDPLKSAVDMVNPHLKAIPEITTGTSLYYEDGGKAQPIKDTRAYNSTTKAIGDLPGVKELLNAKKVTSSTGAEYYEVDPWRMYWLKLLAGRFIQTGERLTDERKDFIMRALNSLTGVKIYTPDIEKEKENRILDMLRELGATKTFTTEYVPKETKQELGIPTRSR